MICTVFALVVGLARSQGCGDGDSCPAAKPDTAHMLLQKRALTGKISVSDAPGYFQITSGSCADQGGVAIDDMAECEAAATMVGFSYQHTNTYTCAHHGNVCGNQRPRGCFKEGSNLQLFPDSTGACNYWGPSSVSTACLCKPPPEEYFQITSGSCADQGGVAIYDMVECRAAARALGVNDQHTNTYACAHHGNVCGNQRPAGCFKEGGSLQLFPDSTGACNYWGPWWVSTACLCKPRPEYFQITSGSCADRGGMPVRHMDACEAAATVVGFGYQHTNTYTCAQHGNVCGGHRPAGCFREGGNLQLFPDSTGACSYWGPSSVSTACFCEPLPDYFQITSGSCTERGGEPILDMGECEEAARAVAFGYHWQATYTCAEHWGVCGDRRPRGCFKEQNQLALFPDSTGACFYWGPSWVSTACFCKKKADTTTSTTTTTTTTTTCFDDGAFVDEMGLSCDDWPSGDCQWAGQWGYSARGQSDLVGSCGTRCGMCELPQYFKEARGLNYCSGAYRSITSSAECREGAHAVGSWFSSYDFDSRRAPTGCFETRSSGGAYYNRMPNGRADSFYSPICAKRSDTSDSTLRGYKLVAIRSECQASQQWISCVSKTVAECAENVRAEGGQFFQFGIGDQFGQCFMKRTAAVGCPEGFRGTPFYNFYRVFPAPATTAAPTTAAPTDVPLDPNWRDALLAKHNDLRADEGASDMPALLWDPALEASAQRWADKCTFGHSSAEAGAHADCAGNACGQQHGENLWMSSGYPNLEGAVVDWYEEKADYNYGDGLFHAGNCAPGRVCGHYTQVVAALTLKLGCAVKSDCAGQYQSYIVCQYSPAGNVEGETLFTRGGVACGACPIGYDCCEEGLCVGTPPGALHGGFSWDMHCAGSPQHYTLGACEATPLVMAGKSHQVATLAAKGRAWAVEVTLYGDSSCSGGGTALVAQEVGVCGAALGFNSSFAYAGSMQAPPCAPVVEGGCCNSSSR